MDSSNNYYCFVAEVHMRKHSSSGPECNSRQFVAEVGNNNIDFRRR
jgi:hypothetical protein